MHSIENNFLKVGTRNLGAELTTVFNKKNGIEYMWQADPKWWAWHAPVLFPVVGRCLNDTINLNGKKYSMQKHGFARKSMFELIENTGASLHFELKNNETSEAIYPYQFSFIISFSLHENRLQQSFEVHNKNDKTMLFSLGAHPAFAVPFCVETSFLDYCLVFEKEEELKRMHIDTNGFFDGRESIISTNGIIDLRPELFNDDALIFKTHTSRSVLLKNNQNSHSIKVDFEGFPYLGIWTKEGAPYVCIEPWLGCADTAGKATDFSQKEGVLSLVPHQVFKAKLNFEFE